MEDWKIYSQHLKILEEHRAYNTERLKNVFRQITDTIAPLQLSIECPRVSSLSVHRPNYDVSSVEDFYRASLFIPFLESVIEQLKVRFSDKVKLASNFEILLPKQCHEKGIEDERFLKLFEAYSDTLISSNFSYTYLQCQSPNHKWVYR